MPVNLNQAGRISTRGCAALLLATRILHEFGRSADDFHPASAPRLGPRTPKKTRLSPGRVTTTTVSSIA
jgi:hypothetical protein